MRSPVCSTTNNFRTIRSPHLRRAPDEVDSYIAAQKYDLGEQINNYSDAQLQTMAENAEQTANAAAWSGL